jgi:hypothetical protein
MAVTNSNLRPRGMCNERQRLAARYVVADAAYTKNIVDMKDAPKDLGEWEDRIMLDLRQDRDSALGALLRHTQEHDC